MKNILMIATYFPPMAGIGTVRVTKYVKYLRNFNWNPTVVTISDEYITDMDESLLKDLPSDVEIYRLKFKRKNKDISFDFYKALKKQLDSIMYEKKYDAVYITGGPFGILPIGDYIYKKYKINFVLDLRDPWKLQRLQYSNKKELIIAKIKRNIKGIIEKKSFKNARYIFTVNDTMTKQYQDEYPNYKEKFKTISNGFDIEDYTEIKSKNLGEFTIVYAGKFETAAGFRNPRPLLKTIKKLNENGYKVKFLQIGQEEKEVKELIEQENCSIYCQCTGWKPFRETISYCKGANILVIICGKEKSEQTGKIFDYICCEKPIVTLINTENELTKVCKKFNNIYQVKMKDENEIYRIILSIYNNNNNSDIISKNDLEHSEYNRITLTKELADILGDI